MNLRWNTGLYRFEVEFQNFTSEQPQVKDAGFKTDGPPVWIWYSTKTAPLTKLREMKPPVLTITPEARAAYTRLKEIEDTNEKTKALLAVHTKALKKKLKEDKQDEMKPGEYLDTVLGFICLKVTPKSSPPPKFVVPPPPALLCAVCKDPLYDYEYPPSGPRVCSWCQKNVLDNALDVC